jgi:broad specificity phosphatase PhoE
LKDLYMFAHLPDTIVYVRHPECRHNLGFAEYTKAVEEGVHNKVSPVTARGKEQAVYTAEYLRRVFGRFDLVFASDFTRTHAIPVALGVDFIIDPRMGERWQGELHEWGSRFFAEFPEERRQYEEEYYTYRAGTTLGSPTGENCPDVERRVAEFLLDKSLFGNARSMLISSHGITGLCFRKVLLQASVDDWHKWYGSREDRLRNASVTVYKKNGDGFELAMHNHVPWDGFVSDRQTIEA